MAKNLTADRYDDLPAPKYEIVREEHYDTGDIWLIKLGAPILVRNDVRGHDIAFAEAQYVNVISSSWQGKDDKGNFTYEESTVTAAAEDGADEKARIYFVSKRLDLWQIMANIGAY